MVEKTSHHHWKAFSRCLLSVSRSHSNSSHRMEARSPVGLHHQNQVCVSADLGQFGYVSVPTVILLDARTSKSRHILIKSTVTGGEIVCYLWQNGTWWW